MFGHLKNIKPTWEPIRGKRKRMMHCRIKARGADSKLSDDLGIVSNHWRKGERKPRNTEQLICSITAFEVKHLSVFNPRSGAV